jgi:diguanylate cyclase (GGDEF)-like protein/PAS domain S-box-containing protein
MNATDKDLRRSAERALVDSRGPAAPRRIAFASAVVVALVGSIGFAGWAFNIAAFRSVVPGLATMKANTAITLFLIGFSLFLLCREPISSWKLSLGRAAAWAAMAIAAISLAETCFRLNFGIDQIFFRDWGTPLEFNPGRMAPFTALSFMLLSSALILQDRPSIKLRRIPQAPAVCAACIALVAIVGYIYSAVSLYKIASFTSMALPTSISIEIAALGILCSRPRTGLLEVVLSSGPGGTMVRRLVPFGLVAPIVLGWLALSGQRAGYYGVEVGIGLMIIAMIAMLTGAFVTTAKAINRSDRDQREISARAVAEDALREGEERFRALANNISQFAWMADEKGYIFWYNDRWFNYTGTTLEEMAGWGWQKVHHPDHVQRVVDTITKCFQSGEIWEETFPLRGRDGKYRWFLSRAVPIRDPQGKVLRWFGTNTDISERKASEEFLANKLEELRRSIDERKIVEEALFVEKERAQVTLNSIGDAVVCTNTLGNITFFNRIAEEMAGWSWKEAAGKPMAEVLRILDATTREAIPDPMQMAVEQNRSMHIPLNCVLIRRDGFETPIEDSVAPIHDREGKATGAVIVFRDVSVARAMGLQMAHSAEHDFLTGLPNRTLLNDRINRAIALAPRHMKKVGVLFLDLDGFKHINDSLGHPTGDKLLQSVAKRLSECVRGADTVSRQGGDEFVVLLSEMARSEDAAITARRMLQVVAEAHSIDQHDLHVTTSIGVSVFPDDGLDAETLIKNADTAMYQAKEHGRQSYQFFKPAMNVRAVERQSIEESLRRALERNEFALHYQPKVNLRTLQITGAEALLRWTHPVRGLISPAQFIPVAEDCGLILPIGNWVLREACKQALAWLAAGLPLGTIAVNISAMEFRDPKFLDGIFEILRDTGLDPGSLELELTESVLMKHAGASESVLKTLRARGVQLAVDDFGTGYSSLSYLRKFSVDALKIDQSFVRQITTSPEETSIVTAVISMGRSLKLRVIAEGVETPEELAFLQAHECDEAQGYFFSRPVPPEQFAKLLVTGVSELVLAVPPQVV